MLPHILTDGHNDVVTVVSSAVQQHGNWRDVQHDRG